MIIAKNSKKIEFYQFPPNEVKKVATAIFFHTETATYQCSSVLATLSAYVIFQEYFFQKVTNKQ